MLELKKDELLRQFPFRDTPQGRLKNESIFHVLPIIDDLLWPAAMNQDGEIALRLFDYQADINTRIEDFKKMREELPEDLQARAEEYEKKRQELVKKHFDRKVIRQSPSLPYELARDPDNAEEAFLDLREEYQEVFDKQEEINEAFNKKMEGIKTIKLVNTEPFYRSEIASFPGELVRAVRPILKPEPASKKKDEKEPETTKKKQTA